MIDGKIGHITRFNIYLFVLKINTHIFLQELSKS